MLIELKRCNSIGRTDGILFFVSMLVGKESITRKEIMNRCAHENGIKINCTGIIAFFEYLGYIEIDEQRIYPTDVFVALADLPADEIIPKLIKTCINKLISDGIFDTDNFKFDADGGQFILKKYVFPLAYAAIRNFLIMEEVFNNGDNGDILVSDSFEQDFTSRIRQRRKEMTLDQLLKQKEEQSKRGLEAEEFILSLERSRLPKLAPRIKRISDFDVAAGYDIASFVEESSTSYDKLIEVKTYIGNEHFFWSDNETAVAQLMGDKYWLCLVDFSRITDPDYKPKLIQNPYNEIFSGNAWFIEPSSYLVQKIRT